MARCKDRVFLALLREWKTSGEVLQTSWSAWYMRPSKGFAAVYAMLFETVVPDCCMSSEKHQKIREKSLISPGRFFCCTHITRDEHWSGLDRTENFHSLLISGVNFLQSSLSGLNFLKNWPLNHNGLRLVHFGHYSLPFRSCILIAEHETMFIIFFGFPRNLMEKTGSH